MNQIKSIFTAIAMAGATLSSVAIAKGQGAQAEGAQGEGAALSLTFKGLETQEGAVMGVLFDSEDAYNGKGAPIRQIMITADKAEISTLLSGLKPGRYAIKSFHDLDGDHKMSSNPYGMPIEPFAFSNDAAGNMGPAKWADAAFEVKAGANSHSITIK